MREKKMPLRGKNKLLLSFFRIKITIPPMEPVISKHIQ